MHNSCSYEQNGYLVNSESAHSSSSITCGCPLYHTWKHKILSSLAGVGPASKDCWVSWCSLEAWKQYAEERAVYKSTAGEKSGDWGVTHLAEHLLISFSSNQLSLAAPVIRKASAQTHSLILLYKWDSAIACGRSQFGDKLAAQVSGLVRTFCALCSYKSNYLMTWCLLLTVTCTFCN